MLEFDKLQIAIEEAERILLVTHLSPDSDAIGSSCAMMGYLKDLGKNHVAFCGDGVPENLRFLPWASEIISDDLYLSGFNPDLVVVLDQSTYQRIGLEGFIKSLPSGSFGIALVDHHPNPDIDPDINLLNISASSTAEILAAFFEYAGYTPFKGAADALMAGLLGDTEGFTNAATSAKALRTGAQLMRWGAEPKKLDVLMRRRSLPELKLFGLSMARVAVNQELGVAVTYIKAVDLVQLDLASSAMGGISNYLKRLGQDVVALVLRETDEGYINGSLRSLSPNKDVSKLARCLSGGGHVQAAGFRISGHLERTKEGHWQVV